MTYLHCNYFDILALPFDESFLIHLFVYEVYEMEIVMKCLHIKLEVPYFLTE